MGVVIFKKPFGSRAPPLIFAANKKEVRQVVDFLSPASLFINLTLILHSTFEI